MKLIASGLNQNGLIKMIDIEIDRIGGSPVWQKLIRNIVRNFDGIQVETNDLAPEEEITYILRQIRADDPDRLKEKILIQHMSNLEAFQFRAMKVGKRGIETWDPLAQPYLEFIKEAVNLYVYHDECRFPPPDVIKANLSYKLQLENQS